MNMLYKLVWFFRFFFFSLVRGRFVYNSYMGSPVFIQGWNNVSIGSRFRCFPGARIEVHKNGRLEISNNVAIAQNIHLTCGLYISIGEGVCIAPNVCLTDIKHNYESIGKNILEQKDTFNKTLIGDNCFLGYGSVIDHGVILGEGCIVAANSYVRGGVYPRFSVIAGNPAKVVKTYG